MKKKTFILFTSLLALCAVLTTTVFAVQESGWFRSDTGTGLTYGSTGMLSNLTARRQRRFRSQQCSSTIRSMSARARLRCLSAILISPARPAPFMRMTTPLRRRRSLPRTRPLSPAPPARPSRCPFPRRGPSRTYAGKKIETYHNATLVISVMA